MFNIQFIAFIEDLLSTFYNKYKSDVTKVLVGALPRLSRFFILDEPEGKVNDSSSGIGSS